MELYTNTANALIDYLKRHGYPAECIVTEWGNNGCAIDIAIMAKDLITPIAIYEIKGLNHPQALIDGVKQLKRAVSMLNITTQCNLVFAKPDAPYFEVFDVTSTVYNGKPNDGTIHSQSEPISYDNIAAGAKSKNAGKRVQRKQKQIDSMKPLCWIVLPVIIFAIILLDAFKIYSLTTLRLIIIGVLLMIVLLPFFSEISLSDKIVFKRDEK